MQISDGVAVSRVKGQRAGPACRTDERSLRASEVQSACGSPEQAYQLLLAEISRCAEAEKSGTSPSSTNHSRSARRLLRPAGPQFPKAIARPEWPRRVPPRPTRNSGTPLAPRRSVVSSGRGMDHRSLHSNWPCSLPVPAQIADSVRRALGMTLRNSSSGSRTRLPGCVKIVLS